MSVLLMKFLAEVFKNYILLFMMIKSKSKEKGKIWRQPNDLWSDHHKAQFYPLCPISNTVNNIYQM